MGAPIDPEQPNTYLRISERIATYDSYLVRVEPELSIDFITNIYPLRIDSRIIPICSHGSITRRTEDGPSSYGWLRCDLDSRCIYSSLNYYPIFSICGHLGAKTQPTHTLDLSWRQGVPIALKFGSTLAWYDSCLWIEPMVTNIAIGHLPTSLLTALPTLLPSIVLAYDSGHLSRSREPN